MAALQLKEDAANGKLILESPLLPRLGGLVFSLAWVVFIVFILFSDLISGQADWINAIIVLVFALLPTSVSFLSALVSRTAVIDRNKRALTQTMHVVFLPISSTTWSFNDVAQIELQYMAVQSDQANVWLVNAENRNGKRIRLNWQGSQREMTDLAQKVAAFTGAPVAEQAYQLPKPLEQMIKRIAPEPYEQLSHDEHGAPAPQVTAPAMTDTTPQPVIPSMTASANEMPQLPGPIISISSETPSITPARDVANLSISELEQRVAGDSMDSDARFALARKYHARGQIDRAIALYQETVRLDPSNSNVQNDLGVALQLRGKRKEAEAAYRRAIALEPFSSSMHLNLGLLLRDMNRASEASQEFYQARQNARDDKERRAAEAVSTGTKIPPLLSKT